MAPLKPATPAIWEGQAGLLAIEDFYDKFLSIHELPATNRLWLAMNDISLSTATNGKVFFDNLGEFSRIREGLLKHYPDDVRIKRLAYECTQIAQSGQYNFPDPCSADNMWQRAGLDRVPSSLYVLRMSDQQSLQAIL